MTSATSLRAGGGNARMYVAADRLALLEAVHIRGNLDYAQLDVQPKVLRGSGARHTDSELKGVIGCIVKTTSTRPRTAECGMKEHAPRPEWVHGDVVASCQAPAACQRLHPPLRLRCWRRGAACPATTRSHVLLS